MSLYKLIKAKSHITGPVSILDGELIFFITEEKLVHIQLKYKNDSDIDELEGAGYHILHPGWLDRPFYRVIIDKPVKEIEPLIEKFSRQPCIKRLIGKYILSKYN